MLQTRLPSISRPFALAAGLLLALASWSSVSAGLPLLPEAPRQASVAIPMVAARASLGISALPLVAVPDPGRMPAAVRRHLTRLPFGDEIARVARAAQLDPLLLASIVEVESSFRPDAVSPKGAQGLMQLMPVHFEAGEPGLDPGANLQLGARLFARLLVRYDGDLEQALAAYQAGPGAVDRFGGVPPFRSTRGYVRRVLARYLERQTEVAGSVSVHSAALARDPGQDQRGF
jgi:soluble lytic murein transglycosylase-like protein